MLGWKAGWKAIAVTAGALVAAAGAGAASLASCAQTPTNVPVQTMEQPQNVAVVCMHVLDENLNPIDPPIPVPQSQCAPVPANTNGAALPYHLYALVTQTTRGELAVVDLTAGLVVDEDPGTPGINFLPIGRLPTDVTVTPDGQMAFVGSGAPNAPAIYALPSTILLGDSQYPDSGVVPTIPDLTTWPVCALPQAPGALAILPTNLVPSPDAGAPVGDAGAATVELPYVLVAVLPGDSVNGAKVVTMRVEPFFRGAGGNVDAGGPLPSGPTIDAGSLTPCSILQYIPLGGAPASSGPPPTGPAWDDGVKWVDGGVAADLPASGVTCAGTHVPEAGALPPLGAPRGGATVLDTAGPRPTLYVADNALPIIHVIDLSNPAQPTELSPLLATSAVDPRRVVSIKSISVSPTTRDYKRFLYGVDRNDGSILVYDVTDPVGGPRVPLTRPHQELNPFQPPDRILFSAPVAAVSFVRHDWPLTSVVGDAGALVPLVNAQTGLLCNPNPNIVPEGGTTADQGPFLDPGGYYRQSVTTQTQQIPLGPSRLRGIFAFATLSSGAIELIDVDDWDAPCRRPDPLALPGTGELAGPDHVAASHLLTADAGYSAIAPAQPSATDLDPYHAPVTFTSSNTTSPVSLEWFFPATAPHRSRSFYMLRNDVTNGNHAPYLLGPPQLYLSGAPIATSGTSAIANTNIVPVDTPFVDPSLQSNPTEPNPANRIPLFATDDAGSIGSQSNPFSLPGVRFAWEDPQVQVDQDWAVTYEGTLPGFYDGNGNPLVQADVIQDDPSYQSVSLVNSNAQFCGKGIEDFALGQQRAGGDKTGVIGALAESKLPAIASYSQRVVDYVQLTDSILDPSDGYWTIDNACWNGAENGSTPTPDQRQALCTSVYGQTLDPANPSNQRDFPILEAYDGRLRLGRFAYVNGKEPPPRTVVGPDPSNVPFMKLMQCCFHNQVHFNVRTGGQWSAVGSANGFLHHVVATGADRRCQESCDLKDALLNGRAVPIPRPTAQEPGCYADSPVVNRDSPLALRNPMFSFLVWNGQDPNSVSPQPPCADQPPVRDMVWRFSTRGGYTPYSINLAATTTALSPQSMLFIDSLGQLALVDGESQGLILIDLNIIAEAHAPYF